MRTKTIYKKLAVLAFAVPILMAIAAPVSAGAYTPPVSALKIGLNYDSTAQTSANLRNADGFGSGFEFGYYDSGRNFVSIGAATSAAGISIIKDRNVYYYPAAADAAYAEYREGTTGDVVVGCYHIQIDGSFGTYAEAKAAADYYQSSFVKFVAGQFYVCTGNYISEEAALADMYARGIQSASITSGTATTVPVVLTGTNTILFEFDYGTSYYLAVQPVSSGVKCETWFRGNRYNGGFQFIRQSGEMTIINVVNPDDYVKGVVHHEMGAAWPLEALKAQACCARTYGMAGIGNHSSYGFDLCTGEHCQVYKGRNGSSENSDRAADETAGMYITYNGTLCQTYFSSSDGGATENVENVWRDALPYLRGVIDPYEADVASQISNYAWTLTYTSEELSQRVRSWNSNCATVVSLTVSEYSEVGNVISVTVKDSNGTSFKIAKRDLLNRVLGVPSIRFTVGGGTQPGSTGEVYVNGASETISKAMSGYYAIGGDGTTETLPGGNVYAITGSGGAEIVEGGGETQSAGTQGSSDGKVNGVFTISGTGRGHSVGMSQWGAYSMAKYHNKTFLDIIHFYFTGVTVG